MPNDQTASTSAPRSVTVPIIIIAVILAGAALHAMVTVLLPFVVALFLSNIFRPMVAFLRRHHVPMGIALIAVVAIVGAALVGVGAVAVSSVQSLAAALPRYEARWNSTLLPTILELVSHFPTVVQDQVRTLQWSNIASGSSVLGMLATGAGGFVSVLSGIMLILLFMLFILGGQGLFQSKIRVAYPEHAEELAHVIGRISTKTERYFITLTLINLGSAVISTGILAAFNVDLALLWGLITFLVNFIPTIGSVIALVLPVTVAFLQFDNVTTAIIVAVLMTVIQFVWGSVISPRVMGSSLNLSPLLILLSLIFWGWVWGPWGMILSVPITSMIEIALDSVPATRPLAILMGADAKKEV